MEVQKYYEMNWYKQLSKGVCPKCGKDGIVGYSCGGKDYESLSNTRNVVVLVTHGNGRRRTECRFDVIVFPSSENHECPRCGRIVPTVPAYCAHCGGKVD